jgi:hypothetical protein
MRAMMDSRLTVLALVGLLLAASCGDPSGTRAGAGDGGSSRAVSASGSGQPGSSAPNFSVRTFSGDEFRLSKERGSPVVLNFWESW